MAAAEEAAGLGIPCIALFPYTEAADKNPEATEAWNPENLVCRATRAIKAAVPEVGVLLDVALDPYNSDGHDGLVRDGASSTTRRCWRWRRWRWCRPRRAATSSAPRT